MITFSCDYKGCDIVWSCSIEDIYCSRWNLSVLLPRGLMSIEWADMNDLEFHFAAEKNVMFCEKHAKEVKKHMEDEEKKLENEHRRYFETIK